MKKILISALLASAAFTVPALAANVTTPEKFCAEQRLSASDEAECSADLRAAVTAAEKAKVMEAYQSSHTAGTPLRNDLRADDAGVKNADQSTSPTTTIVQDTVPAAPSSVTVEPRSGASVTTGSPTAITTPALVCSDSRLSVKEQDDCSLAMKNAASADEQFDIQKRYEARLTQTPLRNDLKSNDAGVKGAAQPSAPPSIN